MATMAMVVVIGYQVYDVARADYGMSVREAAFQLGLLGLVQFVPLFLLTPVAGWAADRFDRRTVARARQSRIDMSVALALGWLTCERCADPADPVRVRRAARRRARVRRPGAGGDRAQHRPARACCPRRSR